MNSPQVNLMGMDRASMASFCESLGERRFRADQITKWIHQRGVTAFDGMTDLSKELRSRLSEVAFSSIPEIAGSQLSTDGTRKWLLRLHDGNCIEAVYIPEPSRGTLCISSQVGCALNCTFCATAQHGYNRNLDCAEIVGQLWVACRELEKSCGQSSPITNVVLMGMGEPLLNFEQVVSGLRLMLDDFAYGLSRRRITLSTAGVVPGIDRLREECAVSLAVSLHAPNDELRDQLVPLNKKYPIAVLIDACRRYVEDAPRARVTFEYTMLDGVNDSREHAIQLISLLRDLPVKVNLIPFNGFAGTRYRCSAQVEIDRFRDLLYNAGIMTMTRKTRGDDIAAACGQLAGEFQDRTRRSIRLGMPTAGAST